jgi:hypothetical protein
MSVMGSNLNCGGAPSEFGRFRSIVRRQRLETTSGATARPTEAAASSTAEEHFNEDAAEFLTDETVDEKVDSGVQGHAGRS